MGVCSSIRMYIIAAFFVFFSIQLPTQGDCQLTFFLFFFHGFLCFFFLLPGVGVFVCMWFPLVEGKTVKKKECVWLLKRL